MMHKTDANDRNYCVYLVTNLVNGKQYVGQTKRSHMRRWAEHKNASKNGKQGALNRAIRKYGPDSFTVILLHMGLTEEEANSFEKEEILERKSMTSDNGYNMTEGADGGALSPDVWEMLAEKNGWKEDDVCPGKYFRTNISTKQLCSEYLSGLSSVVLAQKYGVSSHHIVARLEAAGVPRREPCSWRKDRLFFVDLPVADLVLYYEQGSSANELAKTYGCDVKTILRRLQSANVVLRSQKEAISASSEKMSLNNSQRRRDVPDWLIVALYRELWSTSQIAKHFGMDQSSVFRRLKKIGEPKRRSYESKRDRRFEDPSERDAYIRELLKDEEGRSGEVRRTVPSA